MKNLLYTLCTLFFVVFLFIPHPVLQYILGLTVIACMIVSVPGAKLMMRIVSSLFVLVGLILYSFSDLPWHQLPMYMTSTVPLAAMLFMLPLINSVFKIGRYERDMRRFLSMRMKHYGQYYYRTLLVTYLFSLFLFFGSIPLVNEIIRRKTAELPEDVRRKFIAGSMLRGFSAAAVWSPMEILVILAVSLTGVSYLSALPWLLGLSVAYLLIELVTSRKYRQFVAVPNEEHTSEHTRTPWQPLAKSVAVLFLALAGLIVLAKGVEQLLPISYLSALVLTIPPFTLIWALLIRKLSGHFKLSMLLWKQRTGNLQNIWLLFFALGLFNQMADASGLLEVLGRPLLTLAETPLLLFIAIQIGTTILSLTGFHPLVTISLFGMMVAPLYGQLPPLALMIVLITSSLSTSTSGTYNTTVNMAADILKVNPYRISWWNLGFSLVYGSIGIALALLIILFS